MLLIIKHFINLCGFKTRPEQTPYSLQLMFLTIISYMAMAYVVFSPNLSTAKVILIMFVDVAMLLGFVYAGLWVCSLSNRAVKVVTAMAGSGAVLYVIGFPVIFMLQRYAAQSIIPTVIFSLWTLWKVGVTAHIIRHGLNIPLWLGLGISVLYVYTYLRIMAAVIISG